MKSNDGNDFIKKIVLVLCQCVPYSCQQENVPEVSTIDDIIYDCCRILRNSCALGEQVQNQIGSFSSTNEINVFSAISTILSKQSSPCVSQKSRKMCWQLVANLGVQNQFTQRLIWQEIQNSLVPVQQCVCDTDNARECTMILYNIFIGNILLPTDAKRIVEHLLKCNVAVERPHDLDGNDFHQVFLEHLITGYRNAVPLIDKLESDKRLYLWYYVADHMKDLNHELISSNLLQFVCREFKKKSDCVLKTVTSYVDSIHPKEVVALLDIIAQASPNERYAHLLAGDGSLFLNIGCLLQTITKIGSSTNPGDTTNIFAPVQKLEQLAPNSSDGCSIERDISYQLKSTLVRTLGNLAYKNRKNQDLVSSRFLLKNYEKQKYLIFFLLFCVLSNKNQAREMDIIMAVLDSTNLDARNPCKL